MEKLKLKEQAKKDYKDVSFESGAVASEDKMSSVASSISRRSRKSISKSLKSKGSLEKSKSRSESRNEKEGQRSISLVNTKDIKEVKLKFWVILIVI
jgi:hypothetical protein